VFIGALLAGSAWFLRPRAPQKAAVAPSVPTARVYRGVIDPTRRVAGSISAGRFANVAAPVLQAPDQGRGLTLTYLAASGTRVKKGQMIAQIDGQDIKDHLDDVNAGLVQAQLDIKRRKAQLLAQMENLKQGLRVSKATLDKARQDARAIPVTNPVNQEILRLAVEEYQEAYTEAVKQMPLTEQRQLADLKLYELSYEYDLRHRDRHMTDFRRCTIQAPMDGMVVMQTTYRGGEMNQIKVGDRLSPGQPFMAVVDPDSMQLDAMMSQSESELVRLGQRATVRFDAFPDIVVQGRVQAVGAFAMGGRRINYYVRRIPVRVRLETGDARVIPDLSASADVVTGRPASGLIVPREALSEAEGKTVVYVKQGDAFLARPVEIATATNTQVAVRSGIEEGQEVALQTPASVIH
jgi:cobalt-zinc-cadmium efflux system membrane fusion protein